MADLSTGADAEGGDRFANCEYNDIKNHWRMSDPTNVANLSAPQPGMIVSDEDDEKLYHRHAASWAEIVQGDIPLSNEVAVIVGADSDGKFYYDEAVNDEVVIEARAHADTEGVTVSLLETNQRFRLRQNGDILSWYLNGTDAFMRWSDGQLEFQTDEADAATVLRIKPNGTSEVSQLDFYDTDGIRLSLYTAADRAYIESVGGVLGINPNAAQGVDFFEDAASGETQEVRIYGFRAADALRSLEIGVGVDAADTASFDGVSNYYFDGNIGINIIPTERLHIKSATGENAWIIVDSTDSNNPTSDTGIEFREGTSFRHRIYNDGDMSHILKFEGVTAGLIMSLQGAAGGEVTLEYDLIVKKNISIGVGAFGANAANILAMLNDTAPTTSPANTSQMWSADVLGVANKAGPHWRSEEDGMYAWHGGAGTINCFTYQDDIADDGSFTLPAITDSAWGFIQAGDNEEYALFTIDDDGDVTLISNSANVVANADTDGKICLGTSATEEPLVLKNRLGAQKNINLIIWYS